MLQFYKDAYTTRNVADAHLNEGDLFATGYIHDFSNPLAAGASINIALAFPTNIVPVFFVEGISIGNAMGYLYENASVTGGTSLIPVSKNRAKMRTSQAAILLNPTVTSTGTLLFSRILPGGVKNKAAGGETGAGNFVLKGLTTYLFRITNIDSFAHATEMLLEWYE